MKNYLLTIIAAVSFGVSHTQLFAQDHGHLNVGAVGTNQNDPLTFDNADIFETATNYVSTLTYTNGGRYAGYYQGNITFTALAATAAHAGPVANAPALGAFIHAQLVSVDGPVGGAFAFWESGATNPTFSVTAGMTATNTWKLSENNGVAGTDPYGHFHGRRFTATKPGIYTVGFRAWDFSTNGVAGGAMHSASEVLKIYFQAGICIANVEPDVDHTHITFGAKAGYNWQVQYASSLPATNWMGVGTPFAGTDLFVEVLDDQTPTTNRFYRVLGETP